MKCNQCNSYQPEGVMFCTNCGSKLEAPENVVTTVVSNNYSSLNSVAEQKTTYSEPPSINMPPVKFFNPAVATPVDMKLSMPQAVSADKKGSSGEKRPLGAGIIVTLVILAVLFVASAGANVWQYINTEKQTRSISSLDSQISQLNTSIDSKEQIISDQKESIESLTQSLDEWGSDYNDILPKAEFMDDYVVVVSDDGSNYYHKYGCDNLDMSSFWVFNVENAIGQGYEPCPYCVD